MEALARLSIFLAVFAAMASWEVARPRRPVAGTRWERWPANLGLVLLDTALIRVSVGGAAYAAAMFAAERGVGLLNWVPLPTWAAVVVTILGLDLVVYLQHVLLHSVPPLWRLHRVHHADLGFDTTTGVRFHPIEICLSMAVKAAVIILLGALPLAVVAFEALLSASSLFNHGNVDIPRRIDRWLRWVIVTPDMHRVHHSTEVVETNSNFGFSVSWWDRLFGTYRPQPALGPLGMEIGLREYREPLRLGQLLLLPFERSAGRPSAEPASIRAEALHRKLEAGEPVCVLDVRGHDEFHGPLGRIGGSVSIPVDQLAARATELDDWRTHPVVPV